MTHRDPNDPLAGRTERTQLRSVDEADRMWAALEGDLPADDLARFEDRVAADPALRERVRGARALDEILPLYSAPDLSKGFTIRVLDGLEQDGALRPPWYARRVSLTLPVAAAAAAAVLCTGLVLAWLLLDRSQVTDANSGAGVAVSDSPGRSPDLGAETGDSRALRGPRRSFGPRIVIGAAGSAAAFFDLDAEDELFPLDAPEAEPVQQPEAARGVEAPVPSSSGGR